MADPLQLSMAQQFELERLTRTIDECGDTKTLQNMAKLLLKAWQSQKAATQWMLKQQLAAPARVTGKSGLPAQGPVRPMEPNQRR